MEDFYISKILPSSQLKAFLQAALPGLTAYEWNMMLGEQAEPMEFDSADPTHIFFETSASEVPHFPQHLAIYRTPGEDEQERALWLGQKLSAQFDVGVIVPFAHPEKPQDPFYDILFLRGVSYLADDSETEFGEPDAKPVRIIGPYALAAAEFDSLGNLIEPR